MIRLMRCCIVAFFGLAACDERPKTRYEIAEEQRIVREAETAAMNALLEGQTLLLIDRKFGGLYHARGDCPDLLEVQRKNEEYAKSNSRLAKVSIEKIIIVKMRKGRLVDEKGFFHDSGASPCSTCIE